MKDLCKVYETPTAFSIEQFREGVRCSGQFGTSTDPRNKEPPPWKLTETDACCKGSMVELLTAVSWSLEKSLILPVFLFNENIPMCSKPVHRAAS